ncbi:hypothetical protein NL676_025781 [Syzygium grande]|nr:hypothetical protein NL676_025781 [Syzygium grande]
MGSSKSRRSKQQQQQNNKEKKRRKKKLAEGSSSHVKHHGQQQKRHGQQQQHGQWVCNKPTTSRSLREIHLEHEVSEKYRQVMLRSVKTACISLYLQDIWNRTPYAGFQLFPRAPIHARLCLL